MKSTNYFKNAKCLFLITLCIYSFAFPQTNSIENNKIFLGFNYGYGSHQRFPAPSRNYYYKTTFYKLQLNYKLPTTKRFNLAINLEPGYYINRHKSFSIKTQKNNTYTQTERLKEYTLNVGLQAYYPLLQNISPYILVSIGPTVINKKTDRLSKGISFSNIFATGLNYRSQVILFDLRFSLRHVSNAGMNKPNRGYNSLNFEAGFSIPIK